MLRTPLFATLVFTASCTSAPGEPPDAATAVDGGSGPASDAAVDAAPPVADGATPDGSSRFDAGPGTDAGADSVPRDVQPVGPETFAARLPRVAALVARSSRDAQLYVSVDGEVLVNHAWGDYRVDTLVGWGSAIKPLTCVGFMSLVEEGRVSVDDLVSEHIAGFEVEGKGAVRIAHLLTHTGHLGGYAGPVAPETYAETVASIIAAPREVPAGAEEAPTPGTEADYNPPGIWILGEIHRRYRGYESYPELARDTLFLPAGMNDTYNGIDVATEATLAARLAANVATSTRGEEANPAGGAAGPIWQLGRFYEIVLRGRGRFGDTTLLSPATLDDMTSEKASSEGYRWGYCFSFNAENRGTRRFGDAPSDQAYGHNGATGSLGFADPAHSLVFASIGIGTAMVDALYADLGLPSAN